MAACSAILGRPFMPWQRAASALLNEHDQLGRRVHPLMVVAIQRQTGKTSWLLAEAVERCLLGPRRRRVWYTAQNGQYAREKWGELVTEVLEAPALAPLVQAERIRATYTNGAERLIFPNGSTLRPFPPTRDALHSMQSDLVIVDEAWKHTRERGAELLQAIGPTQATRPGAQTVVVSTAGTLESLFLWDLVTRGRAGDRAVTYLEYGIPDDVDPLDVPEVARYHPAVGHTIDVAFLWDQAGILADKPGEFARAYGNRWTASVERVIPIPVWAAAATADKLADGPIVLGVDVAQDRTRGAIVACRDRVVEVLESRPGVEWVADRVLELVAKHRPEAVAVDRKGPAGPLADALERAGLELAEISTEDYAAACTRFADDIAARQIRYRLHPALDAAVAAAARRNIGDRWVWGRRTASAPICELVAATLADWADTHRPIRRKPMARG